MAEEGKKRKAKRIKKEEPDEITNEFYMPFEDAMKRVVMSAKKNNKDKK